MSQRQYQVIRAFNFEGKLYEINSFISEKEYKAIGESRLFVRDNGAGVKASPVPDVKAEEEKNAEVSVKDMTEADIISLLKAQGTKLPKDRSRESLLKALK